MAMLEVKDLEVYYGVIQAIKGVSFHVEKGEVIALIGANGAGKTTILHTVTGLLSPAKILRRLRLIKLYLWVWRMFRRDGVYLRNSVYMRI